MQDRLKYRYYDKKLKQMIEIDAFGGIKNPLQCTGLKDKNGKLIYEGDIVLYKIGSNKHHDVVKWSEERCGWVKGYQDLSTYKKYCEVIGNIYENKDLLNEVGNR